MADAYRPLPRCMFCGNPVPDSQKIVALESVWHRPCALDFVHETLLWCRDLYPDELPRLRSDLYHAFRLGGSVDLPIIIEGDAGEEGDDPIIVIDEA